MHLSLRSIACPIGAHRNKRPHLLSGLQVPTLLGDGRTWRVNMAHATSSNNFLILIHLDHCVTNDQ